MTIVEYESDVVRKSTGKRTILYWFLAYHVFNYLQVSDCKIRIFCKQNDTNDR